MHNRLLFLDRYEAAIRLERSRQRIRECTRYGFPITQSDAAEARAAWAEYDAATDPARL